MGIASRVVADAPADAAVVNGLDDLHEPFHLHQVGSKTPLLVGLGLRPFCLELVCVWVFYDAQAD